MKIGISGASGQLGRAVLAEVRRLAPEHRLVAITRSPEDIAAPVEGRLGDYDRPATLADAYAGLDRLLLIPSADLRPGVRSAQAVAAVDAAVAAGVGHVFLLSATGTRRKAEPAMGAAYWAGENRLVRSDAAAWTILRMNYFAETLAQEALMAAGTGALAGLAENRVAYVGRDDVAAACAGALLTDGHAGATYNLTGSASVGGAERAALLSKTGDAALTFATMPEAQLRVGMAQAGLPPFIVDAVASMQAAFAEGAYDIVTGDIAKLAGRPPRPLSDLLAGIAADADEPAGDAA